MDKPAIEIGQEVRIIEGGFRDCLGMILNVERTDHGPGRNEWICSVRLTRATTYDHPVGKVIKLWSYKLRPIYGGLDPNHLFKLSKRPKRVPKTTYFVFKCGPCGWESSSHPSCPNCGRARSCHECGATTFNRLDGRCRNCGENYAS